MVVKVTLRTGAVQASPLVELFALSVSDTEFPPTTSERMGNASWCAALLGTDRISK
jgi:hypothetical protein